MIVVRLWGGLGNQMFQYACAYAVAKRNSEALVLDTRFFNDAFLKRNPHFSKQHLNLVAFPIEYKRQINCDGKLKFINFLQGRTVSRVIRIPKRFSIRADRGMNYIKETRLEFLPDILSLKNEDIYLDGYWQTEKYFKQYTTEIKRQFTLNSKVAHDFAKKNKLSDENTVAVHMRMGDYASKRKKMVHYNYIINHQYYEGAIAELYKKIHNPKFYIFSNNIEKARRLLGNSTEYVYVNEKKEMSDLEEFEVMSLCSNHVISNSTFSWWAAWLSLNKTTGYKIAPDIFFGNKNIIPENWIKIGTQNKGGR